MPVEDGERLADALVEVLAAEASEPIREALLIDGFVRLTIDDYRPVLELRSSRVVTARGPLDGLIVADLSRVLAGPYCTMLLADMGATVIKVESPAGDETRTWTPPERDGVSTYYLSINRNKRSIVLDFNDADDVEFDPRAAAPRRRRGRELQARRAAQVRARLRVGAGDQPATRVPVDQRLRHRRGRVAARATTSSCRPCRA